MNKETWDEIQQTLLRIPVLIIFIPFCRMSGRGTKPDMRKWYNLKHN